MRRCQAARRGGGPPARRAADRPPRRRPVRPALHLATPSPDHQRRRDPGPPGPLHRLAAPPPADEPHSALAAALQPDPRSSGRDLARPGRRWGDVMSAHDLDADVADRWLRAGRRGAVGAARPCRPSRGRVRALPGTRPPAASPAAHLDHEIMRVRQSLDLADVVAEDLVGVDDYQWFGADGELLLRFDRHGLAPSGWEGSLHVLPARARGRDPTTTHASQRASPWNGAGSRMA